MKNNIEKQNRDFFIASLRKLEENDRRFYELARAVGLAVESPVNEIHDNVERTAIEALALLAGEHGNAKFDDTWVAWWVYENKYGKGGLTAGIGKDTKLKKIDTALQLWNIIQRWKNRNT